MEKENTKVLNIFQKMLKITSELPSVVKGMEVKGIDGKVKYLAVGEKDILDTVKPLEDKYGIYSFPFQREFEKMEYKDRIAVRCKVVYRFVNVDNPTEMIDIVSYGDGIDTQDKAPGKAMTYADKYALMKAYKISTGEDPDQEASPEVMISEKQLAYLNSLLVQSPTLKANVLKHFSVDDIANLTGEQAKEAIDKAKKTIDKAKAKKAAEEAKAAKETKKAEAPEKPSEPVKDDTYVDPNTGEVVTVEPVKVEEVVLQTKEDKVEPKAVEETTTEEKPVKETEPVEKAKPTKKVEHKAETKSAEESKPTTVKANPILLAKINARMDAERLAKMLAAYKCKKLDELTEAQAKAVLARLDSEKK